MEEKCPVCNRGTMIQVKERSEAPVLYCTSCVFSCSPADIHRIAAAVALAKLTVQMKTCRAYCPESAFLHAQDRVLEVFK